MSPYIAFFRSVDCQGGWSADSEDSILCSDYAIRRINEPFVKEDEDKEEWAL